MMRTLAAIAIATSFGVWAQSADTPLSFEVASIKPVAPTVDGRYAIRMRVIGGELNYSAASLKAIIQQAYEVRDFHVSGPDWMASTRFDIVAKLPADAPRSKAPETLRSLLAERFQMTSHAETKGLPMYALVVGKNGIKMTESAADPAAPAGWTINK
jgi:uncharacterized protein (TIGR03435 family)